MRKAAEEQVSKSQELARSAQNQVQASQNQTTAAYEQLGAIREQIAISRAQLEGQIRPALVARFPGAAGIQLVNIGSGPALDVRLSPTTKGGPAMVSVKPFDGSHSISFIEPKQIEQTRLTPAALGPSSSLQCTYKSLSGELYYTVVDMDGKNILDTRFYGGE